MQHPCRVGQVDQVTDAMRACVAAYNLPEGETVESKYGSAFDPFQDDATFVTCGALPFAAVPAQLCQPVLLQSVLLPGLFDFWTRCCCALAAASLCMAVQAAASPCSHCCSAGP